MGAVAVPDGTGQATSVRQNDDDYVWVSLGYRSHAMSRVS